MGVRLGLWELVSGGDQGYEGTDIATTKLFLACELNESKLY